MVSIPSHAMITRFVHPAEALPPRTRRSAARARRALLAHGRPKACRLHLNADALGEAAAFVSRRGIELRPRRCAPHNAITPKKSRSGDGSLDDRTREQRMSATEELSESSRKCGGSINGVGWRFQSFRINDLELVAQIFPRWNRLQPWFELAGAFKDAA